MMDGIADAIKLGTKIVGVLERLTTDTRIKDEFRENGHIRGTFSLNDYFVEFIVQDKKHTMTVEPGNPELVEKVENTEAE